ncbi:hypothetical protein LTR78_007311 [Recurvomyces mirabilis]|uniref:Uncharacterized protein n=1 Tax=Recurvomyces mirabilis TaxID=574656 RepID=A0AAE0WI65_9PEZI|nr:hypothetical protein LTR78_007311 [Recurvomyces mirabilis]KAK5155100.1 hypothetical protein LTS14_006055 [Recurvomyces mirabilis]
MKVANLLGLLQELRDQIVQQAFQAEYFVDTIANDACHPVVPSAGLLLASRQMYDEANTSYTIALRRFWLVNTQKGNDDFRESEIESQSQQMCVPLHRNHEHVNICLNFQPATFDKNGSMELPQRVNVTLFPRMYLDTARRQSMPFRLAHDQVELLANQAQTTKSTMDAYPEVDTNLNAQTPPDPGWSFCTTSETGFVHGVHHLTNALNETTSMLPNQSKDHQATVFLGLASQVQDLCGPSTAGKATPSLLIICIVITIIDSITRRH